MMIASANYSKIEPAKKKSIMEADRIKWNHKYREMPPRQQVSPLLQDFVGRARKGRALDIACGGGRHAVFLAGQGFEVDAVDISEVGLAYLQNRSPKIHPIPADLDEYRIPRGKYDLIINFNFLLRRLYPQIIAGLKPGGMVIFQTYLREENQPLRAPHHEDYLLKPNELPEAFRALRIIYYREEKIIGAGAKYPQFASLVAIKEIARSIQSEPMEEST